jgi:hypothetical protein
LSRLINLKNNTNNTTQHKQNKTKQNKTKQNKTKPHNMLGIRIGDTTSIGAFLRLCAVDLCCTNINAPTPIPPPEDDPLRDSPSLGRWERSERKIKRESRKRQSKCNNYETGVTYQASRDNTDEDWGEFGPWLASKTSTDKFSVEIELFDDMRNTASITKEEAREQREKDKAAKAAEGEGDDASDSDSSDSSDYGPAPRNEAERKRREDDKRQRKARRKERRKESKAIVADIFEKSSFDEDWDNNTVANPQHFEWMHDGVDDPVISEGDGLVKEMTTVLFGAVLAFEKGIACGIHVDSVTGGVYLVPRAFTVKGTEDKTARVSFDEIVSFIGFIRYLKAQNRLPVDLSEDLVSIQGQIFKTVEV